MKRRDLKRKIIQRAQELDIQNVYRREGGKHELLICHGIQVTIPRHKDIDTYTAAVAECIKNCPAMTNSYLDVICPNNFYPDSIYGFLKELTRTN